jgi:hypothetical protein
MRPRDGSVLWTALGYAVVACLGVSCAAPPVPQGDVRAQGEDLEVFTRDVLNVDRSYSASARTDAEQRIASLRTELGRVSDVRFVLTLAQIVALADNGHTVMLSRGTSPGLARVGIRMTPFGEDFFVVRSTKDHADLLGGRLVGVDDVSVVRLREVARTLRGGIASWRDRSAPLLLESPGQLYAMGLTKSSSEATYRFETRSGAVRAVILAPVAMSGGPGDLVSVLDPGIGASGWQTLLAEDRAPWSLREFDQPFRQRDAPELDAIVIQLHANIDAGGQSIAQFLEAADAARRLARRDNVVLDMRFNGGGNLQLTRAFMASLPSRLPPTGRLVVLTSPWTFSAAISSVGYLKQAGGDRVVLVGEAPGDRLQFWAEGQPVRLPNSGALILIATQRHDYLTGCRNFSDCHPYVRRFPIAVKSLAPEVSAPWTLEAYAAGRDPGMEAAASILGKR